MKNLVLFLLCAFSLTATAQAPAWMWAQSEGDTLDDAGTGIVADDSGNIYMAGYFGGAMLVYGNDTLINPGNNTTGNNYNVLLAKYDQNGNVIWARGAGGDGTDAAKGIAVDAQGNIYVAGYFCCPAIVFGSVSLVNPYSSFSIGFLVKYDPSGNAIWARRILGTYGNEINAVSVDAAGNCYVTGDYYGPYLGIGSFTLVNASQSNPHADAFVAKYDSSGTVLWARSAGGPFDEIPHAISTDAAGNSLVAGQFKSASVAFGATTLNNSSFTTSSDLFLVKYDASGNVTWAKSASGNQLDCATGVCSDSAGNCYLTGYFNSSSISFGTTTMSNNGSDDIFLVKYDSSGNLDWATSAGGTGADIPNAITCDAAGSLCLGGYFESPSLTFGSTLVTKPTAYRAVLIAKYNSAGNPVWAKTASGSSTEACNSVTLDNAGYAYATGSFYSTSVTFDASTLYNSYIFGGEPDLFVAKLDNVTSAKDISTTTNSWLVFPNPSEGIFHFETTGSNSSGTRMEIFNAEGKCVFSSEVPGTEIHVDLSDQPAGIYFYRFISAGEFTGAGKLVVE